MDWRFFSFRHGQNNVPFYHTILEPVMNAHEFILSFDNVSVADATQFASELRNDLLTISEDIDVEQRRDRTDTQDFGATLAIILGTPAVLALAKGIADWLRKRPTAQLTIKKQNGQVTEVIAAGITSEDAAKIAEALKKSI
jgi:hypothetical protein